MSFEQTGTEAATEQVAAAGGQEQTSTAAAEPTVIDLDESALIRIKGQEKPVNFGEYRRGLQSQLTRASQEAARVKQELDRYRAEQARVEQERQRQQQAGQGGPSVFDKLAELPYLTGQEAAELARSIAEDFKQRDVVLLQTLKQLQALKQQFGTVYESHNSSTFETKINKFLEAGGFDKGWANAAKTLYLAYEPGPELDEAFPQILSEYVAEQRRIIDAERQAQLQARRPAPWVPGKGGQGNPSKPLQIDPARSARDLAGEVFDQFMGAGSGT